MSDDVIVTSFMFSHSFDFFLNSKTNLARADLSDISNFLSIELKKTEIRSWKIDRKL